VASVLSATEIHRRRRRRRYAPISEINVTPLVDVMLVLLIVFMVSAPLLSAGVPVDLPETDAGALPTDTQPVTVTVNSDGQIFVGENEVTIDTLVATLMDLTEGNLDQRVFVRGDRASSYGAVMLVMGQINAAGFTRIGLVTLPAEEN
jgi:biopolymer transport protein TolR